MVVMVVLMVRQEMMVDGKKLEWRFGRDGGG